MANWECRIRETAEGFSLDFTGDPERMRQRREALADLEQLAERCRESKYRPSRLLRRLIFGRPA